VAGFETEPSSLALFYNLETAIKLLSKRYLLAPLFLIFCSKSIASERVENPVL
jgi:hypothetical protein